MLVVFGGGSPTGSFGGSIVQTASEGELNLTNGGDVITIENPSGDVVLLYDSTVTGINHGLNQSVTRSPDFTGSFTLHTDANASLLFSPGELVDGSTLSVDQFIANSFNIYPNPITNGYVNIVSKNSGTIKVVVFDVLGQLISNSTLINNKLNVSALNAGIYFLKVSQNNYTSTKKIIIR